MNLLVNFCIIVYTVNIQVMSYSARRYPGSKVTGCHNMGNCTDAADVLNAFCGTFEHIYENLGHFGLPTSDFDRSPLCCNVVHTIVYLRTSYLVQTPQLDMGPSKLRSFFLIPLLKFSRAIVQWNQWRAKTGYIPIVVNGSGRRLNWEEEIFPQNKYHNPSLYRLYVAATWFLGCIESVVSNSITYLSFSPSEGEELERMASISGLLQCDPTLMPQGTGLARRPHRGSLVGSDPERYRLGFVNKWGFKVLAGIKRL